MQRITQKVQDVQIPYAQTHINMFNNPVAPEKQTPNASVSKSQFDGLMQVKRIRMEQQLP